MKILIDPIHTNDPHLCSQNFKMKQFMDAALKVRDDLFFYYCRPVSFFGNEEWDHQRMFEHPRVKYIDIPTSRDRMFEYYRLTDGWLRQFSYFGETWDWDIVMSARVPMFPAMHWYSNAKSRKTKYIVGLEDMPLMSFKDALFIFDEKMQDAMTIEGYRTAAMTFIFAFWEKAEILNVARGHLSGSAWIDLEKRLREVSHVQTKGVKLKDPALVKQKGHFTVGYTKRFEIYRRQIPKVFEVFRNHYIVNGGRKKVRFVVTSNSRGYKGYDVDHDYAEFLRPPREEFWRILQEEMDLFLTMALDEDYPLSALEPICFGVPAVVLRRKWSEDMFGKEYPYFVNNEKEAYAVISYALDDYEGFYAKFAKWAKEDMEPRLEKRNGDYFVPQMLDYMSKLDLYKNVPEPQGEENITLGIDKYVKEKGLKEFRLQELLNQMSKDGLMRHFDGDGNDQYKSMVFMADYNKYRRQMMRLGYVDAGTDVGHMRAPGGQL